MSFSGFGNSNNSAFGGGGSTFGGTNTGFGATTTSSGGLFGGGNNTATSGTFGSGTGGFGANNATTTFGAKPATTGFGSTNTTSGGMFGGGASTTSGFGGSGTGFGASNTGGTTFGAGNTGGGGLFGANKPATGGFGSTNSGSLFGGGATNTNTGFGATNNTSTSAFGGGATTGSGFGASNTNNTSGGFGGFGGNTAQTNNGTAAVPFQAFQEKDGATNQTSHFQSITFQQPYQSKSFEELRVEDYLQGRRQGTTNGQAAGFGTSSGFGGSLFGGNNNTAQTTGGSLFGGNTSTANNTSTGFGGFGANNNTQQPASTGFGANNTSGGLFGAQTKGSGGGLFGSTTAASTGGFGSTNNNTGGGLFGNNNNTATNTGFGANNNASTGGGLFGSNNATTAAKPAFGGFGQPAANTGGFGATNTNTGGGLFGNTTNNNTTTGGGLFGNNNNQQQQSSNPFGGSTTSGGGLFGNNNNQAKPTTGGLFGSTPAAANTGGLFGANNNNQQQQQSGGLFGAQPANNTGGGLFGNNNNQNKPATGGLFGGAPANNNTGGGLFGNSTNTNTNTGGLFGSTNNNNTGGGSLFGNNNANKPAGSLFGGSTNNNNAGGSLFGGGLGNNNNQQATGGSSLFGSTNQQGNNNNNSLFGSTNQNSGQNQQQQLHASLTLSPYGNDQLFSSLGQSSAPVGPLATPLAGARPTPAKTPSLLSSSRLNSPVYTPRASTLGRTGGYGFSYSTYGTPGSAYSVSLTPQASSLLKPTGSLGSALTSRLAKSMSMNNLRGDTPSRDGESLLRPTPGSATSRYLNSGSMRKLTIDRNLRTDLFSPPASSNLQRIESAGDQQSPGLTKKVSFDNSAAAGARQTDATPNAGNALVRTETDEDDSPRMTRSQAKTNSGPEMEQANGAKSLTDIPEDSEPQRPSSAPGTKKSAEKTPFKEVRVGEYYTEPRIKDLKNMSRTSLSKLKMFTVGREGVGKIEFRNSGKGIDLTNVDLDKLFDPRDLEAQEGADPKAIVCLRIRSATVYPRESEKPARGQALNVPSRIYLENSWPRSHGGKKAVLARSGPAYEKHVKRFHNVENTKFVNYEADTGIWVFDVDHFTTYELDDDDDETEAMDDVQQDSSELSDAPATLPREQQDDTLQSIESINHGDVDDTFEFKLNRSKSSLRSSHIPGGFEERAAPHISYDYDAASPDAENDEPHEMTEGLGGSGQEEDLFAAQGGAVQAPSPGAYERYGSSMALDNIGADDIAEHAQAESDSEPEQQLPGAFGAEGPKLLRSILKPTAPTGQSFRSPQKLVNDSWEEQLQRTMSPRKRDRQALKSVQQDLTRGDRDDLVGSPFKRSMLGQSALGQSYLAQKSAKNVGFGGLLDNQQDFGKSQAFRTSMDLMNSLWEQEKTGARGAKGFENLYPKKPRFSAADELDENDADFHHSLKPSFANNGTLVYSTSGSARNVDFPLEPALRSIVGEHREIRFARFVPDADLNTETLSIQKTVTITDIVDGFPAARPDSIRVDFGQLASKSSDTESMVWRLSALLFESIRITAAQLVVGMSDEQISQFEPRLRRDAVQEFWRNIVEVASGQSITSTNSAEEKALYMLTRGDHIAAAEVLAKAKDFRLATLVAQLPGTSNSRELIKKQIEAWKTRNDWSEMSDAVRALYSILAGLVCAVSGKNGAKEDRAGDFSISQRFDLNWTQSFALRLFYGGHESLDQLVKAYAQDLDDGSEATLPTPVWTARGSSEEAIAGREDTLFGLLRLFSTTRAYPADLEALFDPYTVSGSPTNSRLAWQLATILYAKGWTDYISHATLDQITRDFAGELERTNRFVTAIWVLLHLTEPKAREVTVRSLLMRNGGKIPEPSTSDDMVETNVFDQLAVDNKIPESLLYEAKALHAKSELQSPGLQARYLLQAGLFDEAHDVLISVIGPASVIGEDYDDLVDILARFPDHGNGVQGWEGGGAVYNDFALLVTMNLGRKKGREGKQTMQRLRLGLEAMENGHRKLTLEERVSLLEMSRILAEEAREVGISNVAAAVGLQRDNNVSGGLFDRYQSAMGLSV
ncbi:Putative nuclear protein [Septoria linicola]|uniref:Nuclear protein n=1 Tax=Septoria linicola TaxID=215465 RepID=A0A9Q9AVR1_9PEZI|nr:Putative nuclear protein [Septoria linicola]